LYRATQRHAKISNSDAIGAIHDKIEAEKLAVEQAEVGGLHSCCIQLTHSA
jgi:hypothetical protein